VEPATVAAEPHEVAPTSDTKAARLRGAFVKASKSTPRPQAPTPAPAPAVPTATPAADAGAPLSEAERNALAQMRAVFGVTRPDLAPSAPAAPSAPDAATAAPRGRAMTDAEVCGVMEEVAKRLPPVPAWFVRMLLERVGPTELQFFRLFVEPAGGQVEPIVDALRSPAAGAAVLGPIAAAAGEPVTSLLDRWDSSEPWTPPLDLNERVARAVAGSRGKTPSGNRT
jgi:hypothetical protein